MAYDSSAEQVTIESRRVERVYSVLAGVYDGFFDWALGPGRRRAVARLPIQPGDRVLEVGVGTGLSLPIYPEDCHVTGIDISEAMLDRAVARLESLGRRDVSLRRMDARSLSFPDASFDHVLAPYVISVVPEPEKVMAEIRRVVRPQGTVVIVNHFRSEKFGLRLFDRIFTPVSQWIGFRMDLPIDAVLDTPGLTIERVTRVNLLGMWRLIEMRRTD